MTTSSSFRENLPPVGAAVRTIIVFITVLSIPLAAAQALNLSPAQTRAWILALYGIPGLLGLLLTLRCRQPLLLTGNMFMIIFISGLGDRVSFPELSGAALIAGIVVLGMGILGLNEWLASWLPIPVLFGLLAGAVLPFVSNIFTSFSSAPVLIGGTFLAYLVSRALLDKRVPAILPALVTGLALAALTGQFNELTEPLSLALPELTLPVFSLPAVITATPVFVVLMALQANLPSIRFLQSQDYHPPEAALDAVSGVGTVIASLLGPAGVSLALPATAVLASPEAGDHRLRYRGAFLAAGAGLLIGLLAGIAAGLAGAVPRPLLLALAGLAVFEVLLHALEQITQGPLRLGPLFAFAIALSQISWLGFGPFFWSLVIGTGVSLLLEREGLRRPRVSTEEKRT